VFFSQVRDTAGCRLRNALAAIFTLYTFPKHVTATTQYEIDAKNITARPSASGASKLQPVAKNAAPSRNATTVRPAGH